MKKFCIALILLMSLCLSACGGAETAASPANPVEPAAKPEALAKEAAPLPFAEEMGFKFVEPKEYIVPLRNYNLSPEVELTFNCEGAKVAAPVIGRSLPDEEGYVTYEFPLSYTRLFTFETNGGSGYRFSIKHSTFELFDYYTGTAIPSTVGVCELVSEAEEPKPINIEFDDWSAEITSIYTVNSESVPYGQLEHPFGYVYTVRVPESYDGLILGIRPDFEFPELPLGEAPDNSLYFSESWDDQDISDWEFIRLSEHAISTDAYSSAISDAALPFAEKNKLNFVEPGSITVPLQLYGFQGEGDFSYQDSSVTLTLSSIERSDVDEEGYISYTIVADALSKQAVSSGISGSYSSKYPQFYMFDYYTGRVLPSNFFFEVEGHTFVPAEARFNFKGEQCHVFGTYIQDYTNSSYDPNRIPGFNYSEQGERFVYIYRVPEAYDGLMIGIRPDYTYPISSEGTIENYDDYANPCNWSDAKYDEWQFVRVSDWAN